MSEHVATESYKIGTNMWSTTGYIIKARPLYYFNYIIIPPQNLNTINLKITNTIKFRGMLSTYINEMKCFNNTYCSNSSIAT
jgi:hypothetical protein